MIRKGYIQCFKNRNIVTKRVEIHSWNWMEDKVLNILQNKQKFK